MSQKAETRTSSFIPQGFGPARNIVAFTGGDLACHPEFYAKSAEKIKELDIDLCVLFRRVLITHPHHIEVEYEHLAKSIPAF